MPNKQDVSKIYEQPYLQLITKARRVHEQNFNDEIELCKLISVKTGGCPEDCSYCSQSIKNSSKIKFNPLLPIEYVEEIIKEAKLNGVTRICMGGAYRTPSQSVLKRITEYINVTKKHGLESCVTLGSITLQQATELKNAGLDYYNHNIDTSPEYYPKIISTRTFQDRINTINNIGSVGIRICCGGIIGMGESREDRISFIHALTQLPFIPASIPINTLVKIPGTKITNTIPLDKLELIRVIATVRILFPKAVIRLSAGRTELTDLEQATCFMSGANSIFFGEKMLTTNNNAPTSDKKLLMNLGIKSNNG